MEKKQHREPTLYIVGNEERADEIRHILEIKLGGDIAYDYKCDNNRMAYYVNVFGIVDYCNIDSYAFKNAVANGWMKEYKLPEKPKFKTFDKVVVRNYIGLWSASYFSHIVGDVEFPYNCCGIVYEQCLPYNEETAKLIGTRDEWKGGE